MAAAVDAFRSEAIAALEGLDMDIRRALEWIHSDRREHWSGEVRRGWDRITQARLQLQQARTARRVGDHEPSCPDEKKALERAKRRLETAQEKVDAVRHCARAIDEAVNDYRGAKTPLAAWLESEAPKALAALRRMMENLETYVALQAPGGAPAASLPLPPGDIQRVAADERKVAAAAQAAEVPGSRKTDTAANGQAATALSTEYSVPGASEPMPVPVEQSPTPITAVPSAPEGGPA
jgi:hypothetical protein